MSSRFMVLVCFPRSGQYSPVLFVALTDLRSGRVVGILIARNNDDKISLRWPSMTSQRSCLVLWLIKERQDRKGWRNTLVSYAWSLFKMSRQCTALALPKSAAKLRALDRLAEETRFPVDVTPGWKLH
ncbi:hypothetical protein RRG08_039887 [Elysia crispata]|uniref:Uncharacterized protein n=1 Tax=Elysia crispata TaxID=231223 RepID=A0AAE0ZVH1_9GAST|nr:hypothetical protein RRG08_039887 [Elysia crispata]